MSTRRAVTDALERLSFAAELLDDPAARGYSSAAWAIRSLEGDVFQMRDSGELAAVRGVSEGVLEVVDAVLEGVKPDALARMEEQLPDGLFAIRAIKGLGPKKVKALYRQLGVSTLGELEYACKENRLVDLKGFGERTQKKVLEQIARMRETEGLLRRHEAAAILEAVVAALGALPGVERAEAVGEHPRGLELVRQLAVLVCADDHQAARRELDRVRPPERAVELHLASAQTYGARSVWLTSSEAHREALADRARSRGLSLDEEGLRDGAGALVACEDAAALYRALGLCPTPAERREPGVPLVARGKATPRLITRADLRGALHNHTVASDGSATLEQMREAAARRGLAYLGISDHSKSAFYARGLDEERLTEQAARIAELNEEARQGGAGCALLSGVESDILPAGELDYEDEILGQLDLVIASVHRRHGQDAAAMTARLVAAASNPFTAVIGHPTGRLLLGRAPSDLDMEAFLDACGQSGCAVELNANPHRLDLKDEHLAMAKERGVLVSIAADAHSVEELDNLEHGVALARRAGLSAEDVLNARTWQELTAWLAQRRASATGG